MLLSSYEGLYEQIAFTILHTILTGAVCWFYLLKYLLLGLKQGLESVQHSQILLTVFTSLFSCSFTFSVCTELPLLYDLYFYVDNSAKTHIWSDSQL